MNARQINAYLKSKGSPLAGQGATFVRVGRRYGFDPRLLVAIAGAESSFGKHQSGRFNPFGWGPGINFGSYSDAIESVGRGLRRGYFNEGRKTIEAIGAKWAPIGAGNDPTDLNSNWAGNVTRFYAELGGAGLGKTPSAVKVPKPKALRPLAPPGELDLSGFAMQNLNDLGSGRYSPTAALANLTAAVSTAPTMAPIGDISAEPTPKTMTPAKAGVLAELIYDPMGEHYVDGGKRVSGAHGGHGTHVHIALTDAGSMRRAIAQAKKLGLTVRENPLVDPVDPVHTKRSYHYRRFGKSNVGMAADISGDAAKLKAYYRWAAKTFR